MRPNLRRIDYWTKHERRVLKVLTRALQLLAKEDDLPVKEDPINRRVYFHILRAIRQLYNEGITMISYPMYEANNQPDADDEERSARENKCPDFQLGYIDNLEVNPDKSAKQYVVECKRLGDSGSKKWVLNKNYVTEGITRFRNRDHGYAQSSPSGAMIGYVQNMPLQNVLSEVNRVADDEGISEIDLPEGGWQMNDVTKLLHSFDRDFPPSPFRLNHLWLDLGDQR